MTESYTRPSSVDGIKRLARSISREKKVPYMVALDRASGVAGFENHKHAFRKLGKADGSWNIATYLTAYWIDQKSGASGRETLSVSLPTKWAELIPSRELRFVRAFRGLKRVADDHLHFDRVVGAQEDARSAVRWAARTFLFIAASGLRPATKNGAYEALHPYGTRLPGEDHSSIWRDSAQSNRYVLVDEPYTSAATDKIVEREIWAEQHGIRHLRSAWSGMYAPGFAFLFFLGIETDGLDLTRITEAVAKLPSEPIESPWSGESGDYRPIWRSPCQTAAPVGRAARAPLNGLLPSRRRNHSIGYSGFLVWRGARRPDGRMPLSAHQEVAKLLKETMAMSWKRAGALRRIGTIRVTLDEWVQREYDTNELSNEVFFNMYYGGEFPDRHGKPTQQEKLSGIEKLNRIAELIETHYPASRPLSEMVRQISLAKASISTWAGSQA